MLKKVTARAAAATAAALAVLALAGTAAAKPGVGYVGHGQQNNTHAVWCVQHQINYMFSHYGLNHGQIKEDGSFGPQTDEAIRFLQGAEHYTPVDGIVGPRTGTALLVYGDPAYGIAASNSTSPAYNYCYNYIPSDS